jgi:hypothetical protein
MRDVRVSHVDRAFLSIYGIEVKVELVSSHERWGIPLCRHSVRDKEAKHRFVRPEQGVKGSHPTESFVSSLRVALRRPRWSCVLITEEKTTSEHGEMLGTC